MADNPARWRAWIEACREPIRFVYSETDRQPVPDYFTELLRQADERLTPTPAPGRPRYSFNDKED